MTGANKLARRMLFRRRGSFHERKRVQGHGADFWADLMRRDGKYAGGRCKKRLGQKSGYPRNLCGVRGSLERGSAGFCGSVRFLGHHLVLRRVNI